MNYAILRCQKLNSAAAVASSENHSIRRRDKIQTLLHPERTKENRLYLNRKYGSMSLNKIFKERTKHLPRKPRKDAVRFVESILTFSPGAIQEGAELDQWIHANIDFLKSYFGEDNLCKVVLHKDESTIHLHAYTMCITADGRLNANEFVGGRSKLSLMQTEYASAMEQFGLIRGENYLANCNLDAFSAMEHKDKPKHKHQKAFWAAQQKEKDELSNVSPVNK